MPEPEQPPEIDVEPASRGQMLLFALLFYGVAVGMYFLFYALESSNSGARMPWYLVLLYYLGGKWLVAGIFAALGTLCLAGAVLGGGKKEE